jgi:hypothetical protein
LRAGQSGEGWSKKSKPFFFEKKKQKTLEVIYVLDPEFFLGYKGFIERERP